MIRDEIAAGLVAAPGLVELGLEIVATRVASVKPSAEVEKALELPARERIQQEADEATFARRALAVEKERAIAENELHSQIELARREELLIAQRGQNEKKRVTDAAHQALEVEATARNVRIAEARRTPLRRASGERERMEI